MASSLSTKARGRAADVRDAIRGLLGDGEHHKAFNKAIGALQGEAAKLREHRPGDAALADAELAASIAALAAQLHTHKPRRPPGCPGRPEPGHLLAVFAAIYESRGDRS